MSISPDTTLRIPIIMELMTLKMSAIFTHCKTPNDARVAVPLVSVSVSSVLGKACRSHGENHNHDDQVSPKEDSKGDIIVLFGLDVSLGPVEVACSLDVLRRLSSCCTPKNQVRRGCCWAQPRLGPPECRSVEAYRTLWLWSPYFLRACQLFRESHFHSHLLGA